MLHKLFSIHIWLVIAMLMLTACAPSPAPASMNTQIKIESATNTLKVNDTIKVPVKVENIANLTAVELHLSFDPTVMEVISLNNGGFIKADFPVQNSFDNTTGTIDYAVAQLDGTPANGSGTLLEIVFRAKNAGNTPIYFLGTQAAPLGVLLSDSNGTAIKATLSDGSASVR